MKTVWFKSRYIDAILSGEKTDTLRSKRPNLEPGDRIKLQVRYRPAFAEAIVEDVAEIPASSIDPDRLARLIELFGKKLPTYWRIRFAVADEFKRND